MIASPTKYAIGATTPCKSSNDQYFSLPLSPSRLLDHDVRINSPTHATRCNTPGSPTKSKRKPFSMVGGKRRMLDRFIPNRRAMDLDVSLFNLTKENAEASMLEEPEDRDEYDQALSSRLLGHTGDPRVKGRDRKKVLSFKKQIDFKEETDNLENVHLAMSQFMECRILDAPELLDDFYLNLLDWSERNVVAIALGRTVYLWNATTGGITQLMETEEESNHITSVKWGGNGAYLAVGTDSAMVELWDGETCQPVRTMGGHEARVGSLAWNNHILSSGSRDSTIINHDVRIANHQVKRIDCHEQEVCGLQWNSSGTTLASGGNDNLLSIWDAAASSQRFSFTQHQVQAAVKALAWCPFLNNVLASGGGTADRTIRFWNTQTGALLNTVDTKSQVCSLLWSKKNKELLSSHGFSQNQLTLWKYPSMTKVTELTGHTSRVLHTSMSADQTTVVSAAADETLRFWKVFDDDSGGKKKSHDPRGTFQERLSLIR